MNLEPDVRNRLRKFVDREQLHFTENWAMFVDLLFEVRRDNREFVEREYAGFSGLFEDLQVVAQHFSEALERLGQLKGQLFLVERNAPGKPRLSFKTNREIVDFIYNLVDEFLRAVLD